MFTHSGVLSDVAQFRLELRQHGSAHLPLLRDNVVRPIFDLVFDWLVVLGATGAVVGLSYWFAPLAVLLIANRQRALGNILHDAGHRNLCRNRLVNDSLARALLAPSVFASLQTYRETHFKHHLSLGDAASDPDFLPIPRSSPRHWLTSYRRHVFAWRLWLGSMTGHLADPHVALGSKVFIAAWWVGLLTLFGSLLGLQFTVAFAALWLVARATIFHLITTCREMCDHFGLEPGGVFTFTRDMPCHRIWRWLIHPRNNGYHLTHHLVPAVPYYRLPEAQRVFRDMPSYRRRAQLCDAYVYGPGAVTQAWQARR